MKSPASKRWCSSWRTGVIPAPPLAGCFPDRVDATRARSSDTDYTTARPQPLPAWFTVITTLESTQSDFIQFNLEQAILKPEQKQVTITIHDASIRPPQPERGSHARYLFQASELRATDQNREDLNCMDLDLETDIHQEKVASGDAITGWSPTTLDQSGTGPPHTADAANSDTLTMTYATGGESFAQTGRF